MKKLLLSTLYIAIGATFSYGQYCESGGPSQTIDSNLEWLTLNGATGSINYTGCPGVTGVVHYTSQMAYLNAGSSYTVNLQFGTCGGNYSGVGAVWIDFNQDQSFDASEVVGTWQGLPPTAASVFNFNVPAGSTNGQTRMRVMQYEGGSLPLNPCASFVWGSVTDFDIYIQNGVDCSSYIGDNMSDPREVTSLPFAENYSSAFCYTNQNTVYPSPDVFYLVHIPAGVSSIKASLCGSTFDTFLTALNPDGTVITINDDSPNCGTQSEIEISTIGIDSVFLVVEGWGTASGDYTLSINEGTLGFDDIQTIDAKVFPNPATNLISIESGEYAHYKISDLKGSAILEGDFNDNITVDISELSNGTYIINVSTENGSEILKFVKR